MVEGRTVFSTGSTWFSFFWSKPAALWIVVSAAKWSYWTGVAFFSWVWSKWAAPWIAFSWVRIEFSWFFVSTFFKLPWSKWAAFYKKILTISLNLYSKKQRTQNFFQHSYIVSNERRRRGGHENRMPSFLGLTPV